jgi:hypothetical protein
LGMLYYRIHLNLRYLYIYVDMCKDQLTYEKGDKNEIIFKFN